MKKSFLPFLQRDPLGGSFGGGGLADYKSWVGSGSTGSAGSSGSSGSSGSYDGSASIWSSVAANAGSTLNGVANLWNAISGRNTAPTINQYAPPQQGVGGMSTIMVVGIAILLILVLVMVMRPKTAKS